MEEGGVELADSLLEKATDNNVNLVLPVDVVTADNMSEDAATQVTPVDKAEPNWHIVDIGPQTIGLFSAELRQCGTVIWNGPMGIFEFPKFSNGTQEMAKLLADISAITIVCGGSTAEAVQKMGLASKMSHVSTGGGAALKFLEGEPLPGIEALLDR
jgi:phosphoglycerate kinase